jgi:dihydrofolate synthase/folylpolyglutamate synthase
VQPRAFLASLEIFGIKLGLEQIHALLEALGHPERAYPAVSIVGTNGKGSVAAMVERGLRAAGYRTGRYTSPHLIDLEERFAIDGWPVSPESLDAALGLVQQAAASLPHPPTYFEATTAAALLLFEGTVGEEATGGAPAQSDMSRVDVALLEAGLGGRLDATNAVDARAVAVTPIDFDHETHLGNTIAAIAAEKAAVIKPGSVVVTAPQRPDALAVISGRCREAGVPLTVVDPVPDVDIELVQGRARLRLVTSRGDYGTVTLGLRGRHQVTNARTAVALLEALDDTRLLTIGPDAVRAAVEDATWPGRLEVIDVSGVEVLVDGAHNAAGARALARFLREAVARPAAIVLGVMGDKDATAIVSALAESTRRFVCTAPSSARAMPPEDLAALVRRAAPGHRVEVAGTPAEAIAAAALSGDPVVVAGSLYLAGEVRALRTTRF